MTLQGNSIHGTCNLNKGHIQFFGFQSLMFDLKMLIFSGSFI